MAEFRKCFTMIDTENTGVITVEDLRAYMQRMHYKEQFVSKWISLFDPNNEGIITYENYCRTLGLIPRRHDEVPGAGGQAQKGQTNTGPTPSAGSSTTEAKMPEEKPAPSDDQPTAGSATTPSIPEVPKSPTEAVPVEPKSKKSKGRKSKNSQSEKPDEPQHEAEVPTQVEETIVPTVSPGTIPCTPESAVEQHEIHPQKQPTQTQKPKKQKSGRKSTNSQSEEPQVLEKPDGKLESEPGTMNPIQEPASVMHTTVQDQHDRATKHETKPGKTKERKHKHSQSKAEPEHPSLDNTAPDHGSSELTVHETVVQPILQMNANTGRPVEGEHNVEPGHARKGKRHKSHHSQSEQPVEPGTEIIQPQVEQPIQSQPREKPMQGIEPVTLQMDHVSPTTTVPESVPKQPHPSTDEGPGKSKKETTGRKSKHSQSERVEQTNVQVTSPLVEAEQAKPDHEKPAASVEPGKASKPKKSRAKKSSQSHSESHTGEPEQPDTAIQTVDEPIVALQQTTQMTAPPVPVPMQVEVEQSTTPLLSPQPIPPSTQFVCVGQVDNRSPSPLLHDFKHEMEMQQLGAVNPTSAPVQPISVVDPVPTFTKKAEVKAVEPAPKVVQPQSTVNDTVPSEPAQPKATSDKKKGKLASDKTPVEVAPKKKEKKDEGEGKRKLTEPSQTEAKQSEVAKKSKVKETEQPKKQKSEAQKKAKEEKVAQKESEQKKKAEKRKHETSVKSDHATVSQAKTQNTDPTCEKLTRLKRIKPISTRKLKDKKPVKTEKTEESKKDGKEPEKSSQKSRFPRGFIVQPDPERCARKSKLVQRQHERRLQRKIERLEKIKRKSSKTYRPKYPWKVRPSLRSRGVIVILLAGRHRGKRVVCLGRQRSTGLLLVTGPFRYNGCPLRRVHPNMVIATRTCVDLSKFALPLRMHKKEYFARKRLNAKRRKLDDSLLLKPDGEEEGGYKPSDQRKADQLLVDSAVCKAIKAHNESRMLVKYLKSLFSIGKYDKPHRMIF